MSLERRRRLVAIAHERELLVLEDNPYSLLRYEGDPVPSLQSLDGGNFVVYLGTFSKILSAGIRLGWAVAPAPIIEKMNLGKQGVDLCSSSMTQLFVAEYFREGRWMEYVASLRELYRRRRDAMLDALAEHFPREAEWTYPRADVLGDPARLHDTTDLLARALQEKVAFVPGRAAYLARLVHAPELSGGRGRHPRGHPAHRQGRARAGRPVRHAHGRGTGGDGSPRRRRRTPPCPPPVRRELGSDARRVGYGRCSSASLLRSGAWVEDARALGHEVIAIDAGSDLVERLRLSARRGLALHGRDGDGTVQELLESWSASPIPGRASRPASAPTTRCWPRRHARRGDSDARLLLVHADCLPRAGREAALPAIEEAQARSWSPAGQGSALGIKFARTADDAHRAGVGLLLRRQVARASRGGRDLAVSVLDGEVPPIVEAVPVGESSDFQARYEIGRTEFVRPADLPEAVSAAAQELVMLFALLGLAGFACVDLMLERDTNCLYVLEANTIPGLTETSPLPQAADAADRLRRPDRADRGRRPAAGGGVAGLSRRRRGLRRALRPRPRPRLRRPESPPGRPCRGSP
jgi:hypothetical protein